jgi:hypothetical protein
MHKIRQWVLIADRTKVLSASFFSLSALDLIHLFMCKCVLVPNAVKKEKGKNYGNFDTLGSLSCNRF